jgi:hypothetical protein
MGFLLRLDLGDRYMDILPDNDSLSYASVLCGFPNLHFKIKIILNGKRKTIHVVWHRDIYSSSKIPSDCGLLKNHS